MKNWLKNMAVAASITSLSACAMHPLGIDDDTWKSMTPEQQAQAYQQQEEIYAKQQAEREAREAKQQAEINHIKQNPQYGEYVQCTMTHVQYKDYRDWHKAEPFGFDAIKGQTLKTEINYYRNNDDRYTLNQSLYVKFDGQSIRLCDNSTSSYANCATIIGTSRQYARGIKQTIDSKLFKGVATCDMVQSNEKKIIIQNGF